jgi:hypothetical protein
MHSPDKRLEIAKLGFNIETRLLLPGANLHQKDIREQNKFRHLSEQFLRFQSFSDDGKPPSDIWIPWNAVK